MRWATLKTTYILPKLRVVKSSICHSSPKRRDLWDLPNLWSDQTMCCCVGRQLDWVVGHLLMVDEAILSFTFLKCSLDNWGKPAEEIVLLRPRGCPRSLGLGILGRRGARLAQAGLALLQAPDGIPALVLRQQSFALITVGVGQVELRLHLEVCSPMPEDLLIKSVQIISGGGEHLAGLMRECGDQSGVVLELDGPGNRHLLCLRGALVDVSRCDSTIKVSSVGALV